MESLDEWMEGLQGHLRCLVGQVRALLDTDEVVVFGPFLYVYVARVGSDCQKNRFLEFPPLHEPEKSPTTHPLGTLHLVGKSSRTKQSGE